MQGSLLALTRAIADEHTCINGSVAASSSLRRRSLARVRNASSFSPWAASRRGDDGRKRQQIPRKRPGSIWKPSGVRHDADPETNKNVTPYYHLAADKIYSRFLHRKPNQKPTPAPVTIDSCSRAINDPRTSGGLISAIYRGDNILR